MKIIKRGLHSKEFVQGATVCPNCGCAFIADVNEHIRIIGSSYYVICPNTCCNRSINIKLVGHTDTGNIETIHG